MFVAMFLAFKEMFQFFSDFGCFGRLSLKRKSRQVTDVTSATLGVRNRRVLTALHQPYRLPNHETYDPARRFGSTCRA